ncbi:glycosyltransferase family 2 protein [Methylobacterium sp. JK268]
MDTGSRAAGPLPVEASIIHGVTCTIICKNEEDVIETCIRSVMGLVREIVVVDSGSVDRTVARAASLGARVVHNPWKGFGPQKRFAEEVASYDWVLNLDADEWLSEAARAELTAILSAPIPQAVQGFRFHIRTVYPGRDRPRLWADSHNYVRLYDRRRCRFPESLVHDEIKLAAGQFLQVKSPVLHNNMRSLGFLIEKNLNYFKLQQKEIPKNKWGSLARIPIELVYNFFKYYIVRRHFTGGAYGLAVATVLAYLRVRRLIILSFGR